MRDHHRRLDAAQIEALAARAHGHRHLVDLGRREQKFDVLGRLFERFQQAVEGLLRQHVHFIDDVDLGARHDRAVACAFDEFPDIVDAGMRGRVHLDHVDMAGFDNGLAVRADLRHVDRRLGHRGTVVAERQLIIEGAGENAGGGRLADAAHAGQHVGLVDTIEVEGIRQRLDHGLLADQVFERTRAVFARQHQIGRGRCLARLVGEQLAETFGRAFRLQNVAHRPIPRICDVGSNTGRRAR